MKGYLKSYIDAAMENDPAATNRFTVMFTYPGVKALMWHRPAHWLYNHKMRFLARVISQNVRFWTGIEIHPGAKIGKGVFIDHGAGVVIGETAEVGNNVTLYQGVTLGGTGKDTGKRHPTVEDDVVIAAGAKVLGPFTVGKGSKIGAGSVVLKPVPENCTVVGVPGRIVKQDGKRVDSLNLVELPDPVLEEFRRLNARIHQLEMLSGVNCERYSIASDGINSVNKNDDLKGEKNG
ncbi:MAG: serine O-acetyltransferase EpsC [Eubacteriales bacterium]|nr:serine O-acetyltransferase [Christensenellaceae bacterium]MDY2750849.1 serine O-acetyltransferase EpsC [Eubacteriales bacterium]